MKQYNKITVIYSRLSVGDEGKAILWNAAEKIKKANAPISQKQQNHIRKDGRNTYFFSY